MVKVPESEDLIGPLDRADSDITTWSPDELLSALDHARDRLRESRIQDEEEKLSRIYGGELNAQLEFTTTQTVDAALNKLKSGIPAARGAEFMLKSKLARKVVKHGSKLFGPEGAAVGRAVDTVGDIYDKLPKGSRK